MAQCSTLKPDYLHWWISHLLSVEMNYRWKAPSCSGFETPKDTVAVPVWQYCEFSPSPLLPEFFCFGFRVLLDEAQKWTTSSVAQPCLRGTLIPIWKPFYDRSAAVQWCLWWKKTRGLGQCRIFTFSWLFTRHVAIILAGVGGLGLYFCCLESCLECTAKYTFKFL